MHQTLVLLVVAHKPLLRLTLHIVSSMSSPERQIWTLDSGFSDRMRNSGSARPSGSRRRLLPVITAGIAFQRLLFSVCVCVSSSRQRANGGFSREKGLTSQCFLRSHDGVTSTVEEAVEGGGGVIDRAVNATGEPLSREACGSF